MNTTAVADAIATATTSVLLDDALEKLKLAIESSAKSAYDVLASRLTDSIRAHVTNYVAERVGDHAQFGYKYTDVCEKALPVIHDIVYLADEEPFVWHQPNAMWPAHIITNYGRYIVSRSQHCPAKQRLTRNIMAVIRSLVHRLPKSNDPYPGVITALNAVDTIASNTIHKARVARGKADAKAEFDAERAEMNAKNKRLRDEGAAEIAARQRELDERQAELNARQVALDARQAELDTCDKGRAAFSARLVEFQAELDAIKAFGPRSG